MRLRTAGVGLALALSVSPLLAQAPPAATLGQLRPIEDPNITTARGQFPDPRTAPTPTTIRPLLRAQTPPVPGAPAQGGAPATNPPVGQPKPVPNPMVTEYRDQNGQPIPLASTGTFLPPPLTAPSPSNGLPTAAPSSIMVCAEAIVPVKARAARAEKTYLQANCVMPFRFCGCPAIFCTAYLNLCFIS